MLQDFDIFKIQNGEHVWLEAAESLDAATERVKVLQKDTPANYMVYSHQTGKRIVFTARGGIRRD